MSDLSSRIVATLVLTLLLVLLLSGALLGHAYFHCEFIALGRREEVRATPFRITESCLQCICEVADGNCESSAQMCRHFRISRSYWLEAGRPTVQGDVDLFGETEMEYLRCVNNPFCAARTVGGYVGRHLKDCNGDGIIGCYDYVRIHINVGRECGNWTDWGVTREHHLRRCLREFVVK